MSRVGGSVEVLKGLLKGGEFREAAVARLTRPDNLFQPFTTTGWDRYPEEFGRARDALASRDPAILSFGCASGVELLTLRQYFPTSRIRGIDANPLAVRAARKRVRAVGESVAITVARGSDASAEAASAYDLVLALAVFRHARLNESPASTAGVLDFTDFERTVTGLAATVRPGGILMLRHANYRFGDCAVAAGFDLIAGGYPSLGAGGMPTPVYGPDNLLLDLSQRDDGLYVRRRSPA
ncbi:MAG TPA: class I SAM-dependent methyltransferase [Marmoricola sp.]|nr:class I SAM-dependent methyltransferase [Marmoricola sp.]